MRAVARAPSTGAPAVIARFRHDSAKPCCSIATREPLREGGSIDSGTPICSCRDSIVADRGCFFRLPFLSRGLAGRRCIRQLRRRGRARGVALAGRAEEPPRPGTTTGSVWPLRNTWNRATENLYSAWIETLFDAPLDATLSW